MSFDFNSYFQKGIKEVEDVFCIKENLYEKYIKNEICEDENFIKLLNFRQSCPDWKIETPLGGMGTMLNGVVLYCIIRYYNMVDAIETGVSGGFYSYFLLSGLKKNHSGLANLCSVEISDDKKYIGHLVPENLKDIWSLNTNQCSLEWLTKTLKGNHMAQLYCHDSLHTFNHMLKELIEFKKTKSDNFFVYIDDQNSEDFWNKCVKLGFFKKEGFEVKYFSGKESCLGGHFGGFIQYKRK